METLKPVHRHDFEVSRRRMVQDQLVLRGVRDPRVLKIMGEIPRHLFVDPGLAEQAYMDAPLGIGQGQTISQPFTVGMMTAALGLTGSETVLEIGTGCGYQTSVLAPLAKQVYTIERLKPLALSARRVLRQLGYKNIVLRVGDGSQGWPDKAPFDAILVAAGSPQIPTPLVEQLAEGGRLVVPVGDEINQNLMRVRRKNGRILVDNLGPCRFVRLVGEFGWRKGPQSGDGFKKRSLV